MTNEEKAREIAECCYRDYVDEGNMIASSEECYQSALQAMQWKDEQYKWHKVADGDLPNKSDGNQIYLCQIASNKGILKDPLLCCYCGGFVNHITLEPMAYDDNVISWMELPEYTEE